MIDPFSTGIPQLGRALLSFMILVAVCGVRLLVLMTIFPPTGGELITKRIRNAMVVLWSIYVAYGQQALMTQLHGGFLLAVVVKEAVIGLVIAFVASPVFWVAEAGGTYIDDLTGYNTVKITNPSLGQQTTLTSTLLMQCATVAFWTLGGMTFLLGAVFQTYVWWPLGSLTPVPRAFIEAFVMQQTDSLMVTIAKLAGPAVLLLLLVDVGVGLLSRIASKLDLVSLAQPVKGALAVLLLALMIGMFIGQVKDQVALLHVGDQLRALALPR